MTTPLVAITTPPRPPSAADHVLGFVVAVATTVAGAILTPFLALAFVAAQPILVVAVALRARAEEAADQAASAARHAA
jgi:hypothetical protein